MNRHPPGVLRHGPVAREGALVSSKSPAGIDGPITGGALAMTLYGLVAILASAVLDVEFVPPSTIMVAVLMISLLAAGAVVGAAIDRARAR